MSKLLVDEISDADNTGPVTVTDGLNVSSGNVGIGTTSPNSPLEVSNGTENHRVAFGTGEVYLMARNASSYITQEYIANQHVFTGYGDSSSNEAMRIDSSGGLITNPAAGGHAVFNEGGVDADFRVESDTNTHALFVEGSSGNVGIGTSSPALTLALSGGTGSAPATSGTTQNGTFRIRTAANGVLDMGSVSATGAGWLQAADQTNLASSYNLLLNPNGGNVGIGTSSPAATLDVRLASDRGLYVEGSTSNPVYLRSYHGSSSSNLREIGLKGSDIRFETGSDAGTSTTERMRIDTLGGLITKPAAGGHAVFNENSVDADFRVESDSNSNIFFVDAGFDSGQGAIGIGTGSPQRASGFGGSQSVVQITGCSVPELRLTSSTSGQGDLSIYASNSGATAKIVNANGGIELSRGGTNQLTVSNGVVINEDSNDYDFRVESVGNSNMIGLDAGNNILGIGKFGSTSGAAAKGAYFNDSASGFFHFVVTHENTTAGNAVAYFNRQSSDGNLIEFRQADSSEGTISVSGSTVSYNGFSGRHESSGIPANTSVGTVVSTIDALDVYPDTTENTDGNTIPHAKAGQTRADHAQVEISTSAGDPCVYGVVSEFDGDGKLIVTSVGIGSILVTGACSKGDLLESNGDGTAKVQSDDIVRSKTIGKVTIGNSDAGVKLVSCVLYCG
jgi:hypothetical protein